MSIPSIIRSVLLCALLCGFSAAGEPIVATEPDAAEQETLDMEKVKKLQSVAEGKMPAVDRKAQPNRQAVDKSPVKMEKQPVRDADRPLHTDESKRVSDQGPGSGTVAGKANASGTEDLESILKEKNAEITELRRRNEELRAQVQSILAANRKEKALLFYNMGCVYKATREYAKAEAKFLEAHVIDPADADVCYNLGILYDDNLGNKAKARHFYEKFLALSSDEKDIARVREWLKSLAANDPSEQKR